MEYFGSNFRRLSQMGEDYKTDCLLQLVIPFTLLTDETRLESLKIGLLQHQVFVFCKNICSQLPTSLHAHVQTAQIDRVFLLPRDNQEIHQYRHSLNCGTMYTVILEAVLYFRAHNGFCTFSPLPFRFPLLSFSETTVQRSFWPLKTFKAAYQVAHRESKTKRKQSKRTKVPS